MMLDLDIFAETSEENYSDGGSPTPAVIRSAHPSPCHQGTPSVVIEVSHAWPLPPVSPPSMNPACPPCQQTTATTNISPACPPCQQTTPTSNISPTCPPCHQTTATPNISPACSPCWRSTPPHSPACPPCQQTTAMPNISPACPPCQQTTATPNISPACSPCWRYTPPPNSPACPPCQAATPASSPHSASSDITWSPPNETFEEIILDETSFVGVNEADLEDSPDRLESLVKALQNRLPELPPPRSNTINVVRDDVFNCAERAFKRQRFNPEAPIYVVFVDNDGSVEGAVDQGGPRREFLRLLTRDIQHSRIFEGPEESRSRALDGGALQDGLYRTIGRMLAVAFIQGGLPVHFFSDRLYSQISGLPSPKYRVEDVVDYDIRSILEKISTAGTVEAARLEVMAAAETLGVMGALKFINNLEDRDVVVQIALQFYLEDRLAQALTQFKEGLLTLGLLDEVMCNPRAFQRAFTQPPLPLTATDLANLFTPTLSPVGSNRRRLENRTIAHWRDWLLEVEEGNMDHVQVEDVLVFCSGASRVPLSGFPEPPMLDFFLVTDSNSLPLANTCSVTLRLPLHSNYPDFSRPIQLAVAWSGVFGFA
ncbi:G2/M phase-specific E3 ubiquitin-protein ligase-like isoform X2 [Alosa sapidissima]|uniref:G2/M phase-specific E3 ubiquitin-protein ligase-like isoform X2 n=1 Tax=Alosa sapidissima TaxID=34773 RepID=UPI001C0A6483|nr:G2/M phase-specific E3 ubiquitin-protein ligase-like isoform X2 [Alosa sapidissima]